MSDNDRHTIMTIGLVAVILCVLALVFGITYLQHYNAVTADKLEDIKMWVRDTPELQEHVCDAGADGEFDNWDYNRLQQLHSKIRYASYVKQLTTPCD